MLAAALSGDLLPPLLGDAPAALPGDPAPSSIRLGLRAIKPSRNEASALTRSARRGGTTRACGLISMTTLGDQRRACGPEQVSKGIRFEDAVQARPKAPRICRYASAGLRTAQP